MFKGWRVGRLSEGKFRTGAVNVVMGWIGGLGS